MGYSAGMSRWEPDARGRLLRAAIDLFCEQGYDATTTAQIAERAGLTKTTLFRLFPDKREILFQGQATFITLAEEGVRTASAESTDLDVLMAGIRAMTAAHSDQQRLYGAQLNELISSSPELRERAAWKRSTITQSIEDALTTRLGDRRRAGLLADLGVRAYYEAFHLWVAGPGDRSFTEMAQCELAAYRSALDDFSPTSPESGSGFRASARLR